MRLMLVISLLMISSCLFAQKKKVESSQKQIKEMQRDTGKLYPFYPCCGAPMVMVRPDPNLFKWPEDSAMFIAMANYHNPNREWEWFDSIIPVVAKKAATKKIAEKKPVVLRDTIFYPENRFDTIPVPVETTDGKIVNMLAVYQHGRNIAGKDSPRFVGYLQPNKRKLTAAQRPKKVRWDKMQAKK